MALATVNTTPITIQADKTALYSLILAESGGTSPEATQANVQIWADGTGTTSGSGPYTWTPLTGANATATTGTDATGLFTSPVALHPGCVYVVVVVSDTGFEPTRFIAPAIVGKSITAGASL
jgi:hypothetical protein